MIEQRFTIIVSNEESSLSFPIPVRSTQQFRPLKRVIESCVKVGSFIIVVDSVEGAPSGESEIYLYF